MISHSVFGFAFSFISAVPYFILIFWLKNQTIVYFKVSFSALNFFFKFSSNDINEWSDINPG